MRPGNSHAGDSKITTPSNVEDIKVTVSNPVITTDGKRGGAKAVDGQGACSASNNGRQYTG